MCRPRRDRGDDRDRETDGDVATTPGRPAHDFVSEQQS